MANGRRLTSFGVSHVGRRRRRHRRQRGRLFWARGGGKLRVCARATCVARRKNITHSIARDAQQPPFEIGVTLTLVAEFMHVHARRHIGIQFANLARLVIKRTNGRILTDGRINIDVIC